MNETLAIAKYAWTKFSVIVNGFLAAAALGLLIAGIAWQVELPKYIIGGALSLSYLSLILCFFILIGMCSLSFRANSLDPNSGYDQWLMRLPIQSWKLAMIPVGLVTAWLSTVWITIALLVRLFDGRALPLSQALAMSASAIFFYSLVWKPQRSGWHRIALLVVSLPLLYIVAFGVLFVMEEAPQWLPQASMASVLIYAVSIGFAIHSVKQARVSTFQQSRSNAAVVSESPRRDVKQLSFVNSSDALQWHDCSRFQSNKPWKALGVVSLALLLIAILPLSGATAIVAFLVLALITMTLTSSRVEPSVHGFQSSLPSYLLASPIRSRSMAWIRLRGYAVEHCQLILLASLLLLLSFLWQENRATFWRWWINVARESSAATPIRMMVTIYLSLLVVAIGVSLRVLCIQLYGHSSVVLWSTGALLLSLATPISFAIAWFIQQTSWEHVDLELAKWRDWLYKLFFVGLAIKLVVDVIFVWLTTRHLVSALEAVRIISTWSVLVIAAAFAWRAIWPATHLPNLEVPFTTVLMSATLIFPLSICFAAPLAVEANRHRSV